MSETARAPTLARMNLPGEGGAVFRICLYLIAYFFVAVSIYDLVNFKSMPLIAILASVTWPSFVVLITVAGIREDGGARQYLINRLGMFSTRQFVAADAQDGKSPKIRFGYEIFNREFYFFEIDGSAVVSVDWGTGQATAMCGRDMNDWHVALWYRHPRGPQRAHNPGVRDDEVYIFGPSGRRDEIAAFGRAFVEFLRHAGIALEQTADPTEFTVIARPQSE